MFDRLLNRRAGSVRLVGTTHVSPKSRERVINAISEDRPDHVAIELDGDRFKRLWNGNHFSIESLRQRGLSIPAKLLATGFAINQYRMARAMGIRIGEADMLPAARTGREVGADVSLIDAEKTETMNELASRILSIAGIRSFYKRMDDEEVVEAAEQMETLIDEYELNNLSIPERVELLDTMPFDDIERLTDLAAILFPAATETILTSRNERMAGQLQWLRQEGEETIAVVGRAHVPGIQRLLDNPETIPDEHIIEPRSIRFVTG